MNCIVVRLYSNRYFEFCCKSESCSVASDSLWPHGILQARILEWVAFPFSRGIFLTQGSNPGLPHCQWILYQLSHQGNPRILKWIAYPFSRGSSWPRNWTGVFCTARGFFTNWATREASISLTLVKVLCIQSVLNVVLDGCKLCGSNFLYLYWFLCLLLVSVSQKGMLTIHYEFVGFSL